MYLPDQHASYTLMPYSPEKG